MNTRNEPISDDSIRTISWGLGLIATVIGLTWLSARATLLLTGAPAGDAPFERAPTFALALVRTRHAAEAWQHANPHSAPLQAIPFWIITGLGTTLILTVAAYLIARPNKSHSLGSPNSSSRSTRHAPGSPARWASARVERQLTAPKDPAKRAWRLVAGRGLASRRLLAGQDCVSAVVFGAPGSGKTSSLVIGNVIDWDGPVVMTTAKSHDLAPIITARAAKGPVWVIAPGGAGPHRVAGWSPIDAAVDPEAADRIAEWMVESSAIAADPKARPWNAQARKYLKGLLLAAHETGAGFDQWIAWIHAGERARDQIEDILTTSGHTTTAAEYASTWQIHEEGRGSVLFTALGLADTYSRPGVAAAVNAGGFTPAELFDSAGTLCIVAPNSEGERFAPYFTTLISAILAEAEHRSASTGEPLTPRLLLALDEAGNVFHYPRLPHLVTTARGNGIQLLLIYHDLAQLEHLYGNRAVARTVVSNAKMRLLLPGVADLETLRYFSDLLGRTRTQTHGITTGFDGKRSRSTGEHDDHLAPLHQLQQLPDGQAVLLYENLPPAKLRLLPWYRDHRYRHLRQAR